jgi:WD40 repeat protein
MAQIFISHSHADNAEALALRDWLVARGWDDLFLDIDPQRGLVSGQRWLDRLQASAQRCKAVLFVLSRAWLESRYCTAEFWEARKQERPLFAVVIDDTAVAEVPAEMRGVWQLAFLTRGSHFEIFSVKPPPGYNPTEVRFSKEGLESLRLGLVAAGLTSFDTASFPWPARGFEHEADGTTPRRPYRGLKPVDVPDAGVFFGRDADLVRARDHLADLRDRGGRCLVVLLGASGSGKSSFLRAGLLPRLVRDDRRFLPLPVLRPRGAALWGDEGLLAALETAYRRAEVAVTRVELRADIEAGGARFLRRLANLRAAAAGDLERAAKPPTLILSIDQAEELFTTVRGDRPGETGAAEAGLFLARLAELLRDGPEALALVTIRSDAYEPLQTAEALAGVPQVPFNLPPLAAVDYRSVIEGPARRASDSGRSLTLEPGLTAALLADAQGADALPLLGFTLERLYVEHGGDGELTDADYKALGGVQGSIEAAVAEAFVNPEATPRIPAAAAEREALLKRAFVPHLMGVNEANGEPVRRTARRADLPSEARGLIDRLVDRRLLVVDRRAGETVIEVAHEALLRLWPALRRWHDQERAALEIQQEVARASSAWSQNGPGADWLAHRGARLAEAEAVARREDFAPVFAGLPRVYLDACRQADEAEARRLARQRVTQRRIGVLLTAVAIVTLVGGWLVVSSQRDLARQRSRLIAANAKEAFDAGHYDRAMRLVLVASQDTGLWPPSVDVGIQLGRAAHFSRLEAQLTGHGEKVTAAAFSPDGRRIVTASEDGTARVWSRGEAGVWTSVDLKGHQRSRAITAASFSPDGAFIVTASMDGARVWRRGKDGTWASVALEVGWDFLKSVSFSPDSTRIVTVPLLGTARVWARGKAGSWRSMALEGHESLLSSASFSPDGARIVTASWDNTARVWSQGEDATWRSLILEGHQDVVTSASFSPNGAHIVTTSHDNTARIWSRGEGGFWRSIALEGHRSLLSSASFSPDGARIVTASSDATARVWSKRKDGAWASSALAGHQDAVNSAFFSPDGAHIVTASDDGTARVWSWYQDPVGDESDWHSDALVGHQDAVNMAVFSPDGKHILTASDDSTVRVWSQGEGGAWASVALKGHVSMVLSAAFSPGGAHVVTASTGHIARVWSAGKAGAWHGVALEGHQHAVNSASFSSDGSRIVTASADHTARVWSAGKDGGWHSVSLEGHQDTVTSAAFSPDGKRIVTAAEDRTARVWSTSKSGDWNGVTLEGHLDDVTSASFSSDGKRIVTASKDRTARVWSHRGEAGAWISVALVGHQDAVNSAAFSRDGGSIITASEDRTARVWRRGRGGAWISLTLGHRSAVNSAAFSPDGTHIVTASEKTARVWSQGEDGAWTSVALEGHEGWVTSAAFALDGARIVTAGGWDHTARVWDVRWLMGPGDWAKTEPLSLPETVCREKLHGSWTTVRDRKTGREVERIAERLLTEQDIQAAPILAGREGEDVCAPFLEQRSWWSRLAFWR